MSLGCQIGQHTGLSLRFQQAKPMNWRIVTEPGPYVGPKLFFGLNITFWTWVKKQYDEAKYLFFCLVKKKLSRRNKQWTKFDPRLAQGWPKVGPKLAQC